MSFMMPMLPAALLRPQSVVWMSVALVAAAAWATARIWWILKTSFLTPRPAEGPVASKAAEVPAGLDAVLATDPNFSERQFVDRVQKAFFHVERGLEAGHFEDARSFVSETLFERLQDGVQARLARGQHHVVQNLRVEDTRILEARRESGRDAIKVRISSVEGAEPPVPVDRFIEDWTFVRTAGVCSPAHLDGEAPARTCPACKAPISLGEASRCNYCGGQVSSMMFDWVVDRIDSAT